MPAGEGVEQPLPPNIYPGDYLFDYIDGGAPQYLEYGFVEVASHELTLNGHTYIFDVYRMDSPLAAWGIFSVRRPPAAPPIEGFAYSTFTAYQGMAVLGPYFFDISAYETLEQTAAEMAVLLRLAAGRIDPALARADLEAGEPFTHLPGPGRLPGATALARGPLSLRAALGAAATGSFQAAIEAILTARETEAVRQTGASEPHDPPADGDGRGPWWVIAGYHPRSDDEGRLVPQTTLALLAAPGDTPPLLEAARQAVSAREAAEPLGSSGGWTWTAADGRSGFVLERGGDLLCATSVLEADLLRTWAQRLATP